VPDRLPWVRRARRTERRIAAAAACAALAFLLSGTAAAGGPAAPCASVEAQQVPSYGPIDGPPAVSIWHDVALGEGWGCLDAFRGRMALVVTLAGRFRAPGTLEDMAQRVGAISRTEGLRYWSVTDGAWRTLLSEAFALEGPDLERRRPDFSATELLSGRALYTAQRDTRSTDLNLYRLLGRRVDARRLIVESKNLSPIRFLVFELFAPGALQAVHSLQQLEPGVWGYYGVSAVRGGAFDSEAKSFVNRAAAYYRYLAGVPSDRDPPLAP